jgi:hypothetical protein
MDAHSVSIHGVVSPPLKGDRSRSDGQVLPLFQPPASICASSISNPSRQVMVRLKAIDYDFLIQYD